MTGKNSEVVSRMQCCDLNSYSWKIGKQSAWICFGDPVKISFYKQSAWIFFDDPVNIFVTFHLDSRNLWEYFPILACYWLNSERTNSYAQIWDLYY